MTPATSSTCVPSEKAPAPGKSPESNVPRLLTRTSLSRRDVLVSAGADTVTTTIALHTQGSAQQPSHVAGGIVGCPAQTGVHPYKRRLFVDTFPLPRIRRNTKTPASSRLSTGNSHNTSPKRPTRTQRKVQATSHPTKQPTPKPGHGPQSTTNDKPANKIPGTKRATSGDRRQHDRARDQQPERKEYQRLRAQEKREKRIALGLCVGCGQPSVPGQTRCRACVLKHQETHNRAVAKRKAMAEQTAPGAEDPTC